MPNGAVSTNVEFRLGEIEHLPVADSSVDVIISNCVINLSPDKLQVFRDAYRVLKPGGRLAISDVVASAELPEALRDDPFLHTACVSGASTIDELKQLLNEAGFGAINIQPKDESRDFIKDWVPGSGIEDYVIAATIEAVKGVENGNSSLTECFCAERKLEAFKGTGRRGGLRWCSVSSRPRTRRRCECIPHAPGHAVRR